MLRWSSLPHRFLLALAIVFADASAFSRGCLVLGADGNAGSGEEG